MNDDIRERIRNIRLLALDVDGVLTDGGVYVLEDGTEFRRFDIKDGLGLKRVMAAGIEVAIISASDARPVLYRAERLGIRHVYLGVKDKLRTLEQLCQDLGIGLHQVAYMGDDVPDLPVLQAVGLPCAPTDSAGICRSAAIIVTTLYGGHGAVREACDLLLHSPKE